MVLTGKCKEEFYYWFDSFNLNYLELTIPSDFEEYPDSMKYGVLVDYFESVNIYIELKLNTEPTMQGSIFKSIRPEILCDGVFKSCLASFSRKPKARTEAIKKANELRNEQLK